MKSDKLYLAHILQSIEKILDYTGSLNYQEFSNNSLVIDPVIRNFEIIGEATKKVSKSTQLKHPGIPWKKMAGLRDKLIHDYIRVKLEMIWEVITDVLPIQQKEIQIIFLEFS